MEFNYLPLQDYLKPEGFKLKNLFDRVEVTSGVPHFPLMDYIQSREDLAEARRACSMAVAHTVEHAIHVALFTGKVYCPNESFVYDSMVDMENVIKVDNVYEVKDPENWILLHKMGNRPNGYERFPLPVAVRSTIDSQYSTVLVKKAASLGTIEFQQSPVGSPEKSFLDNPTIELLHTKEDGTIEYTQSVNFRVEIERIYDVLYVKGDKQ